jgi:hypothetical protein
MAVRKTRRLALHNPPALVYTVLHQLEDDRVEVKMTMRGQTIFRMLIPLLAVCCLVPLAALAAVLYLAAPVWLVAPAGLLALVLLARRLMALLAADDSAGFAGADRAQSALRTPHRDRH